jgi:hypothetical protein
MCIFNNIFLKKPLYTSKTKTMKKIIMLSMAFIAITKTDAQRYIARAYYDNFRVNQINTESVSNGTNKYSENRNFSQSLIPKFSFLYNYSKNNYVGINFGFNKSSTNDERIQYNGLNSYSNTIQKINSIILIGAEVGKTFTTKDFGYSHGIAINTEWFGKNYVTSKDFSNNGPVNSDTNYNNSVYSPRTEIALGYCGTINKRIYKNIFAFTGLNMGLSSTLYYGENSTSTISGTYSSSSVTKIKNYYYIYSDFNVRFGLQYQF